MIFFLVASFLKLNGQNYGEYSCFSNLFIDRPLLKNDSLAIISNRVSKIKLYERISDDSIPTKKLIGEWNIIIENNKIKSIVWDTLFNTLPGVQHSPTLSLGCYPLIKRDYFKKKIVDIIGEKHYDDRISQFKLTHFINKSGQIYLTTKKYQGELFEDRYLAFHKIEYRYDGNFLVEMVYYDIFFSDKSSVFSRLFFEYYK